MTEVQGRIRRAGKYELLELLGRGGMGEVWRARDRELGRIVAVKMLSRADSEDLARFRREAAVTARLNHPSIAQLFEFGEDFIAMQFIDGGPIAGPEHLAAAARAVHYAHEQGVLHRDLKPANILVSGEQTYVLDFGLAREVKAGATSMSMTGDILGTPSYMSPEQARGEVHALGARTDVYGLGATLYAILEGRPPHTGATAFDVIARVLDEEPARPKGELGLIAMKALEKEPARRYATAAEFADDLGRHFRGEPIAARAPSALYRLRKRIARRPAVWGLSALLVAAVVSGVTGTIAQLARVAAAEGRRADAEAASAERLRLAGLLERAQRMYGQINDELARTMSDRQLGEVRGILQGLVEELGAELPKHPEEAAALHFLMGEAYTLMFQEDEAIRHYAAAMEFPEGDRGKEMEAHARSAMGRAMANLGRVQDLMVGGTEEERRARREQAERLMPQIRKDLARTARAQHVPERTQRTVEHWEAYVMEQRGAAEEGATQEIELGGRREQFYLLRGLVRGGAKGIEDYAEALDLHRGLWRAWFHRDYARRDQGDAARAIGDYDEAIRLNPRYAVAYYNRGNARSDQGDVAEAIGDFDEAIRLNPRLAEAYVNRGLTRRDQGDVAGTIADFDEVIRLRPRDAEAYVNRGNARSDQGDVAEAISDYNEAIRLNPRYAMAYYNRGNARSDQGDVAEAAADFGEALSVAPDNWPHRAMTERLLEKLRP